MFRALPWPTVRFAIALVVASALSTPMAAAGEVRFNRLEMAHGLSQSSVMAIEQCADGYIWFATQYGLDRFDGYAMRSFRHDPGDASSLSHSRISDIRRTADGRFWVLTAAGLDRFDPRTGQAERFGQSASPAGESLPRMSDIIEEHPDGRVFLSGRGRIHVWQPETEQVHELPFAGDLPAGDPAHRSSLIDQQGRFWTFNAAGLWRLDEARQVLDLAFPLPQDPEFRMFQALALTPDGRLALAADHVFKLIEPASLEVVERLTLADLGGVDERLNAVGTTSDGMVWLPTPTRLLRYRPDDASVEVLFDGGRLDPTENARQELIMVEHPSGDVWFASQYGLARVERETDEARVFGHDPTDRSSIPPTVPQRAIALFIDEQGLVWIGTNLGGAAWHVPDGARFAHIHDRSRPSLSSVPFAGQNVVRSVVETTVDEHTDLWLALENAGLRRLRRQRDGSYAWYKSYHHAAEAALQLPANNVRSVVADPHSDLVWALLDQHLTAIDARSDRVVRSIALTEELGLNASGRVLRFTQDGRYLWLGSRAGVWQLAPQQDRSRLTVESAGLLPMVRVSYLFEGDDGQLLVGAREGLGVIEPDAPESADTSSFFPADVLGAKAPGYVHAIAAHHEDGWWLAGRETGLGHVRFEQTDDGRQVPNVRWFDTSDGLLDDTLYALIPQADGQLWISSNNGLMRWNPETGQARHFTPPDGVQALEFNQGVAHASATGYLYFGGINGVNQFRPERFERVKPPPRLRLQEVRVNAQTVPIARNSPPQLRLTHRENDLEMFFVGLQFADPTRTRYAWRLEGVDADWVRGGDQRRARYASLSPGTYRFWLRAANSDGVWSEDTLLLTANIAAPPWARPTALALYGLLLMGLAWLAYSQTRRRRLALEAEVAARTAALTEQRGLIERQASELERALEARTVLFANVSHEFRTPLTLIKASLDRLEREGADPSRVGLGRRYLQRLLKLVDQLMDFSRLSQPVVAADRQPWPLGRMVRMTVEAFAGVAEERGIELLVEAAYGWRTRCDQEQIEKILLNLLTNALKFTPDGGQVRVRLEAEEGGVGLVVSDSGTGIPEHELETVFERFYRVPAVEHSGVAGAGIGLALVREAARANGGRVSVESTIGQGSTFRVFLPAWQEPNAAGPVTLLSERDQARDIETLKALGLRDEPVPVPHRTDRPVVLLVEDNPDMLAYLAELLAPDWSVLQATDGEAGLTCAAAEMPDVIVTDIMMPGMDGLAFLAGLRRNIQTSHIPVLLLTARQDHETRLRGFALKADDFLPKPFDDDELRARLGAMMESRERLRAHLRRQLDSGDESSSGHGDDLEGRISDRDRDLLQRLQQWTEQHYSDPDIKVGDLAGAALVDVRTLQRKLKSLLDRSPAAYLQDVRLARARELLLANGRSIKDIAASCGFSTPQAFSKVFRQAHGEPPSQWRDRQRR